VKTRNCPAAVNGNESCQSSTESAKRFGKRQRLGWKIFARKSEDLPVKKKIGVSQKRHKKTSVLSREKPAACEWKSPKKNFFPQLSASDFSHRKKNSTKL
jgi:hypothetical protein